jgi:cupin fold WbuC family metalloprotein
MDYRKFNDEVLYPSGKFVTLDAQGIRFLKAEAMKNPRHRIRLCTHQDTHDKVHEMFIVHGRDAYVRPHKHMTKTESFYLLEGEVDAIFFDEEGRVTRKVELAVAPGKSFYYRICEPIYHTLYIKSDVICFLEVTSGPFDPKDTVFPSWAPDGHHADEGRLFMQKVNAAVVP